MRQQETALGEHLTSRPVKTQKRNYHLDAQCI